MMGNYVNYSAIIPSFVGKRAGLGGAISGRAVSPMYPVTKHCIDFVLQVNHSLARPCVGLCDHSTGIAKAYFIA